jgi:hypothetical protein
MIMTGEAKGIGTGVEVGCKSRSRSVDRPRDCFDGNRDRWPDRWRRQQRGRLLPETVYGVAAQDFEEHSHPIARITALLPPVTKGGLAAITRSLAMEFVKC